MDQLKADATAHQLRVKVKSKTRRNPNMIQMLMDKK
jgi:hypothetical protein